MILYTKQIKDTIMNYTHFSCCKIAMLSGIALSILMLGACNEKPDNPGPTPTSNKAGLISDQDKLDMIYSLVDLEGDKGRIYEMTYTVDYKLEEALDANIVGTTSLVQFTMQHLMDRIPGKNTSLSFNASCSVFACTDPATNNFLMGRNFDFNHKDKNGERVMIPAIVVHTAPVGGKKSVSFVDGQFINYKSGFYTDGESDLSMLMALPYLLLDGINEDGFAISVLKLDGKPTRQQEEGKKNIFTTVAMRMLLDRASTVNEAVEMLKQYNMWMDDDPASYHYFMADATGDYAIVEYVKNDPLDSDEYPTKMEVLKGKDAWRFVTNFYASPSMSDSPDGSLHSKHGKDRYNILSDNLAAINYKLNSSQAMELLRKVAQGPESELSTGFTQWSEVFNLSKRTVKMSILREYDKTFEFGIE